ncbi:hypothetical protein IMSAG249_01326 [Lachnospiraceae bacterium]|jgi:hypothetical protein|nr:hypothetical protein IMSAG249_01326 [Lachnospiraceae bacterium]
MPDLTESLQADMKGGAKATGKTAVKGIAIIADSLADRDSFMEAVSQIVNEKRFQKTGDIQYSYANVTIDELTQGGRASIAPVEEPVLKEVMSYFDKYCREYNVRYSALKETVKGGDGVEREGYKVFFQGRDDKMIIEILKNACADWQKDQQKMKDMVKEGAAAKSPEKTSVLAKLAFFRNRVKETVDQIEKSQNHDKMKQREVER